MNDEFTPFDTAHAAVILTGLPLLLLEPGPGHLTWLLAATYVLWVART